MCGLACIALGIVSEEIITKIIFSKAVQKSKSNRVSAYAAILLFFLLAQYVSLRWMGVSMMKYVQEEFVFVILLPILGQIVNLIIRAFRVWKIRKRYGDGSDGYVFAVRDRDLEEVNRQNREIQGKYDRDCAVRTRTGIYVGEKYKKTLLFLGIPYAKPPVGALQMYGSVMNEDLSEILQVLLEKFVSGKSLRLYRNEISKTDRLDWKAFPKALIVSDGKLTCTHIEERITEVRGLLDYMVK